MTTLDVLLCRDMVLGRRSDDDGAPIAAGVLGEEERAGDGGELKRG